MPSNEVREPSKSVYGFLEAAFDNGGLVVRDSGVSVGGEVIRHAIDPIKRRILMIPISEDEYDAFVDDAGGGAVSLRRERYSREGHRVEPFLVFRCESAFLRDTFASFVDDLLGEFCSSGDSTPSPVTARLVLNKWRRLFATRGSGLLSDQKIIGLATELRVLVCLLTELGPAALSAWTGPDGADHDLVLPGCSIEVKGTQRKSGLELEINGLGQLNVPEGELLYLAASRVAFSPTGEVSIPGLVDSVLEIGVDRELLIEKLESVGYHHARADEYAKKSMDFVEDRFFEVGPGFPRIDRSVIADVPQSDRIRDVSYFLDLTSHDTIDGALTYEDVASFLREVL